MAAETTLVRLEGEGQVTLPVEVRQRLGLEPGDLIALVETPDGVLITSRGMAAIRALDEMGAALRAQGVTLDEWIESGRAIRGELIRERYGIDPDDDPA